MTASITSSRQLRGLIVACTLLAAPLHAQHGDDSVLRALLHGMRAFASADTAGARSSFTLATDAIAGIWGGSAEAASARRLWGSEANKPFRGEAWERMMAFFYRGLVALQDGDLGVAQAAFRLAVQQDAFAEEEQHRSDVAAPLYLLGVALQAQGSTGAAAEAFSQLHRLRPDLPRLEATAPSPRLLLIVETGTAPRKVSDGINADRLRIFRGRGFEERRVRVQTGTGDVQELWPMEDVLWQATSRGGRPFDFVLRGKARFADASADNGSAFGGLGQALAFQGLAQQSNGSEASLRVGGAMRTTGSVLEGVGAATQLVGAMVNAAADVRYWDNLPDAVHLLPLDLPPGPHRLRVTFRTVDGRDLPELSRDTTVTVLPRRTASQLVWISSRTRASTYLSRGR